MPFNDDESKNMYKSILLKLCQLKPWFAINQSFVYKTPKWLLLHEICVRNVNGIMYLLCHIKDLFHMQDVMFIDALCSNYIFTCIPSTTCWFYLYVMFPKAYSQEKRGCLYLLNIHFIIFTSQDKNRYNVSCIDNVTSNISRNKITLLLLLLNDLYTSIGPASIFLLCFQYWMNHILALPVFSYSAFITEWTMLSQHRQPVHSVPI